MSHFKTKAGTELPLLNLRGKDYLQAAHRIIWFREEKPEWTIETECITTSPEHSIFKAIIKDEEGRIIATAHKSETVKGFADHMEKAETGSISRALALCGYGTQFAQELDEGERLADSPIQKKTDATLSDPSEYKIKIGKKLKGKKLSECDIYELASFSEWLTSQPKLEGIGVETRDAIEKFLKLREVKNETAEIFS